MELIIFIASLYSFIVSLMSFFIYFELKRQCLRRTHEAACIVNAINQLTKVLSPEIIEESQPDTSSLHRLPSGRRVFIRRPDLV